MVTDRLRIAVPAEAGHNSEFLGSGFDRVRVVAEGFDYFVEGQFGLHVRIYVHRWLAFKQKFVNTYKRCRQPSQRSLSQTYAAIAEMGAESTAADAQRYPQYWVLPAVT
jgi:hypothetical protein